MIISKKYIFGLIIGVLGLIFSFSAVLADDSAPMVKNLIDVSGGEDGYYAGTVIVDPSKEVARIIGRIIGAFLTLIGVVFAILVIYGGFLWLTARGNDTKVGDAKGIILTATVGLIIVLGAATITYTLYGFIIYGTGFGLTTKK